MINPITGKTDRTNNHAQVEAISRRLLNTVQIANPILITHSTSMMRLITSHVQIIFSHSFLETLLVILAESGQKKEANIDFF